MNLSGDCVGRADPVHPGDHQHQEPGRTVGHGAALHRPGRHGDQCLHRLQLLPPHQPRPRPGATPLHCSGRLGPGHVQVPPPLPRPITNRLDVVRCLPLYFIQSQPSWAWTCSGTSPHSPCPITNRMGVFRYLPQFTLSNHKPAGRVQVLPPHCPHPITTRHRV